MCSCDLTMRYNEQLSSCLSSNARTGGNVSRNIRNVITETSVEMDLTRRTAVSPAPHSSTPSHLSNWPPAVVTSLPSPLIRTNLIAAKLDDGHYIGYLYNNQFGVEEQIRIIWTPDRLVGCQDLSWLESGQLK